MNDKELSAWVHKDVRGITDETYAVPEYASDRNDCAVVEAEIAEMPTEVEMKYLTALWCIAEGRPLDGFFNISSGFCSQGKARALAYATARQRCEAMYAIREHLAKVA